MPDAKKLLATITVEHLEQSLKLQPGAHISRCFYDFQLGVIQLELIGPAVDAHSKANGETVELRYARSETSPRDLI